MTRFGRYARAVAAAYAVLLLAIWFGVSRWAAIDATPSGLTPGDVRRILATVRALVEGGAARAPTEPAVGARAWAGRVTLYCGGRPHATWEIAALAGKGLELPGIASSPSLTGLSPAERAGCRIKLDVESGRGRVAPALGPLLSLSFIPGVDGVGVRFGEREARLFPDEQMRVGLLSGYKPFPELDFEAALDPAALLRQLAIRLGVDGVTWRRTPHRLFRFRTESWIEAADPTAPPLPIFRGNPPPPPLERAALREGALAGARYLVRHLHADGRFGYQYDTVADAELPDAGDYSLPRHAGAALFLAESALATGDPVQREATHRALRYLVDRRPAGCDRPDRACVGEPDDTEVDLGSSALALAAAVEYLRAGEDAALRAWAERLAAFLLAMQKPDGDFCHLYDLAAGRRDEETHLLFYSGEAALALARLDGLERERGAPRPGRPDLGAAVERALSHLTGASYDYFVGGFFYGEDHWTCQALAEAWDRLPPGPGREAHGDFCEGFARFLRRTQFVDGDGPVEEQPDLVGAYGFTPLIGPYPTPVGSRSEALLSILAVARKRGHTAEAASIAAQLRAGLAFLVGHQVRDDAAYLMPNPAAAGGGFLQSDAQRRIRIDSVQHAGAAMLRAAADAELFPVERD